MSARNGNVTRWQTDTLYSLQYFDATDREIHTVHRVAKGKKAVDYLRKVERRGLSSEQILVDLEITGYEQRLYAMPQDQYFSQARIIQRKSL